MAKKQVSIKEFVKDWKMGISEAELMEKHGLSQNQLQKVYKKLVDAGKIDPMEFEDDSPEFEATVELASACPHCGALKLVDSDICAQCGLHSSVDHPVEIEETPAEDDTPTEDESPALEANTVALLEAELEPETDEQGETDGGETDLGSLITFALGAESPDGQKEEEFSVDEVPEEYSDLFAAESEQEDEWDEPPEPEEVVSEPAQEKSSRSVSRPVLIAAGVALVLAVVAAAGLFTGFIPLPGASEPETQPAVVSKAHKPWAKKIKASQRKTEEKEKGGHVEKKAAPAAKVALSKPDESDNKDAGQRSEKQTKAPTSGEKKTQPPSDQWLAKVEGKKRPISEQLSPKPVSADKRPPVAEAPKKVEPEKTETISPEESPGGSLKASVPRERKPPEPTALDKDAARRPSVPGPDGRKPATEKVASLAASPETAPAKELPLEKSSAPIRAQEKATSSNSSDPSGPQEPARSSDATVEKPALPGSDLSKTEPGKEEADSPTARLNKEIPADSLKRPTLQPSKVFSSPRLALNAAVRVGDVDTARLALDRGADVNYKDRNRVTPLMDAVEGGYADLVKLLLDRGADPSYKDRSGANALDIALNQQDEEMLRWLLAKDKKLASRALIEAATAGDAGVIKLLVSSGADVNAGDKDGNTALMFAAEHGRLDVIRALLTKGADVNATNSEGVSALGWAYSPSSLASLKMRKAVVRLLKQYGAQSRSSDRKR